MSLDNIQLPAIVLQDLYKSSLVDLGTVNTKQVIPGSSLIPYLGNNQKKIVIVLLCPEATYLHDADLNFLLGILSACKLSMADIALINLSKNPSLLYKGLTEQFVAEKILLFGVDPQDIGLPLQFPLYQVQQYNGQVYLSSVSLADLQNDKAEKTKLWNCLKKGFSIIRTLSSKPMDTLIFATNNQNKVDEVRTVLGKNFDIISLKEAGINIDIPEPHDTLEANATEKSKTIFRLTHKNCFSEDTGLEVEALNGEPGVKSARYAGESRSFGDNIEKLLFNLRDESRRNARFRTVLSLILDGKEYLFEGICDGRIISKPRGSGGFGYDPVFVPDGSEKTFGEMEMEEKNKFSHRKKAMKKLIDFLNNP